MADLTIIRDVCKEQGITLKKLAEKLSISEPGLQRIIKSNSTKIETLEKIAEILDIQLSEFFYGRIDEKDKNFVPNEYIISYIAHIAGDRAETFSDKLSLYFDFYIMEVVNFLGDFDRIVFPLKHPERPIYLFRDTPQIENLFEKIHSFTGVPYSKLGNEYINSLSKYPLLFEAFYFPIFYFGYFNIKIHLREGLVPNNEILLCWEKWNKLTNNGKDADFSPFLSYMGKRY